MAATEAPGQTFYQSTSTDANYIADSSQIVVGMDGTVSNNVTGNISSGPLSSLELPVGKYPDAWGMTTDMAIAQNSVFPNEVGPTTQTMAIYKPTFLPTVVSGDLPTGGNYVPAGVTYSTSGSATMGAAAYSYAADGAVGIATSNVAMLAITADGAIGKVEISRVGLSAYIYEGTSTTNMRKGAAHFDCTSGWLGKDTAPRDIVAEQANEMVDRYIDFYNHERIQLKTGEASLTRRLST